ncbi:hypothetical protein TWF128_004853 [Orbilia oligospora]|nr:hypothetical protein TWF128_004853 [Orbilia oligospora]
MGFDQLPIRPTWESTSSRRGICGYFTWEYKRRRLFQCHPCGAAVDRTRQYPKDTLQLRSLPQNNLKDDYLSRRLIESSFYTGSTTLGDILKQIIKWSSGFFFVHSSARATLAFLLSLSFGLAYHILPAAGSDSSSLITLGNCLKGAPSSRTNCLCAVGPKD